jgi:periplasmic copper chaperone A
MKRILLSTLLFLAHTVYAGSEIEVTNAWVREAPPGARMLAAFMVIRNSGDKEAVLTGVDSADFKHVMLHQSIVVDGVARMQHQDDIHIPAGGSVSLEPGSFHLMMPAPELRLEEGDQVEFVLHFSDESCVRITADVKKKL